MERGQEQPHRKAAGEKQGGFEGPPHFRIGFVETKHPAYYFFFPSAGHQVCGGCRLISFGLYKTAVAARQRITRPLRLRGGSATRNSANHELPREEWIEISVPALVSEETFALAQEKLIYNKLHGPRRTIEPSILQGLVHCRQCSYALYRSSSRTSARKIYYYRCSGSDAYRHGGKAICDQKPIRQDLLDQLVWNEILRLLEDPTLIQNELNRRLEAARESSPTQRRLETLNRDLIRVRKSMELLLTAYQEELLSLDELRVRMPPLRQREQAMQAELQAINHQTADRAAYLQLAETLTAFLERLRSNADTLDIGQRQRIMRLLVKEVIVGKDLITIKHSIPGQTAPTGCNPQSSKSLTQHNTTQIDKSYPLCKGRGQPFAGESLFALCIRRMDEAGKPRHSLRALR